MTTPAAIPPPPAEDGHTDHRQIVRQTGLPLLARIRERLVCSLRRYGYETRLYDWRLKGRHPLRLLGTPGDPWPGDRDAGHSLVNGFLSYKDVRLEIEDPDFWERAASMSALRPYALGFLWLRDLASVSDPRRARAVAEILTRGWITRFSQFHAAAWAPAETGERLGMWLLHAPLILASNDLVYRSTILNAMARQARHLMRVSGDAAPGLPAITAATGLILCGLLLPDGASWRMRGEQHLAESLGSFVLPDGGVLSNRPSDLIAVMQSLITLRRAYEDRMEEVPHLIQRTLDRMAPFLRALRHPDGTLAHVNGAGREPEGLTGLILSLSQADGKALTSAPYSGLMRVQARRTVLIFDAMAPPPVHLSAGAHAGTLAFELSDDRDRLVVNMGTADGALASLARTTAAHSTLVLGDRNTTEIHDNGLGNGIQRITVERNDGKGGTLIVASHDGYHRRLRCDHRRTLHLNKSGDRLIGRDEILLNGRLPKTGLMFDLRFHLHPGVTASTTHGGAGVLLRLSSRHGWLFRVTGEDSNLKASLEDSLYLDHKGVHKSLQILVRGAVTDAKSTCVDWSFERLGGKRPAEQTPKNTDAITGSAAVPTSPDSSKE